LIFAEHKRGSLGPQQQIARNSAADPTRAYVAQSVHGGLRHIVCSALAAMQATPKTSATSKDIVAVPRRNARAGPAGVGLYTPTLRLAMWHAFADTRGLRRRKRRVFAGVKCPSYCTSNQLAAPLASRTCSNTCITIMRPTTLQHHSHDTLYIHTHGIPTPALLPSSMVQTQI